MQFSLIDPMAFIRVLEYVAGKVPLGDDDETGLGALQRAELRAPGSARGANAQGRGDGEAHLRYSRPIPCAEEPQSLLRDDR
jgi:hypothetical protein